MKNQYLGGIFFHEEAEKENRIDFSTFAVFVPEERD